MTTSSRRYVLAGALLLAALFAVGAVPRVLKRRELRAEVDSVGTAVPTVSVAPAQASPATTELSLPGTMQALHEASIYARSTGYVRRWYADIGARVRTGELLAELETPELDQELAQARAGLAQASAALQLARETLQRWNDLVADSAATRQELDERRAAFAAAQATASAAEANARRIEALKAFARVTAPFAGVITARNVDLGQLVAAGGSGAKPLFTLAQADTVRAYVNVPQSYAAVVRAGQAADVEFRELPQHRFAGRVARTANAIDPATRTLLTEVEVPNADGRLLPGMYGDVHFKLERPVRPLLVPAAALVMRSSGPVIAVVAGGRVHFQPVQLGRDFGAQIEVTSGLTEGALVVLSPSDEIAEGAAVRATAARDTR